MTVCHQPARLIIDDRRGPECSGKCMLLQRAMGGKLLPAIFHQDLLSLKDIYTVHACH